MSSVLLASAEPRYFYNHHSFTPARRYHPQPIFGYHRYHHPLSPGYYNNLLQYHQYNKLPALHKSVQQHFTPVPAVPDHVVDATRDHVPDVVLQHDHVPDVVLPDPVLATVDDVHPQPVFNIVPGDHDQHPVIVAQVEPLPPVQPPLTTPDHPPQPPPVHQELIKYQVIK